MKNHTALAIWAGALIAGAVTGFAVLPQLFGNGLTVSSADTSAAWPGKQLTLGRPATSPFGTGMLLQTDDFHQLGLAIRPAGQRADGSQRLTGCTGGRTMADLAENVAADSYASALWRGPAIAQEGRRVLRESVTRSPNAGASRELVNALTAELSGCRYSRHGHDRYLGAPTVVHTETGSAVRFLAYDVDGTPIGGVGVFRNGRSFGVFELLDPGLDDAGSVLDSLSANALSRLS